MPFEIPMRKWKIRQRKAEAQIAPRNPCFRTSQVTHVSAYADTATWPGDRLRLPLDPQPKGAAAWQMRVTGA